MKIRTAWPWISPLVGLLVAASPLGQEIVRGLWSGEQLSRSISWAMVEVFLGTVCALSLIEFAIRVALIRSQRRRDALRSG